MTRPLLVCLLLCAVSSRGADVAVPPGLREITASSFEGGAPIGWEISASPIIQAKDRQTRLARIARLSRWLVSQTGGSSELRATSLAAFLNNALAPGGEAARYHQIFFDRREARLHINRFYDNGTIAQIVGAWGPSLSADPALDGGVTMFLRSQLTKLDDHKKPFRAARYFFGADVQEDLIEEASGVYDDGERTAPNVTSKVTVRRERLNGDGTPRSTELIPKETVVVYRAQSFLLATTVIPGMEYGVALLPRVGWRPPCAHRDLIWRFPDASTRNQGRRGTCHLFTTIGLLEGAIHEAYHLDIPLSEEDLARTLVEKRLNLSPDSGGPTGQDLEAARRFGVARRASVPYPREWRPGPPKVEGFMLAQARQLGLQAVPSYQPRAEVSARPVGDPAASDREAIRQAIQGFKVDHSVFVPFAPDLGRKRYLIENLCADRPVGIALDLNGLEGWDYSPGRWWDFKMHAMMVIGFEEFPKGSGLQRFKIRNSWGRDDFFIDEEDLGRIFEAYTIEVRAATPPAALKSLAP